MKENISIKNLKIVARRRQWIPGKLASFIFLAGFGDVWPLNIIIWEKP